VSIEINRIKNNPSPVVRLCNEVTPAAAPSPTKGVGRNAAFKSNPMPQDKVEISSKKKGLSDGAKIGIGIGTLTLIGVGIYKRKSLKTLWDKICGKRNPNKQTPIINEWDNLVNSVKISNLPEQMTFTPFKTKEEAVKYAKDVFKIQEVDSETLPLPLLNDTIDAMVDISNKNHGKFYVPRIIRGTTKTNNAANLQGDPADSNMFGVLELHKPLIDLYDSKIENIITTDIINERRNNIKDIIYHEFGHWQDEMVNKTTILKDNATFEKVCQERYVHHNPQSPFITNENEQNIASKISNYSKNSIGEFIAETYKAMIKGKTIPDDVMGLYRKYNGPMLN
jgi:hypothetical protein